MRSALTALLAAVLVAACSAGPGSSGSGGTAGPGTLEGRTFLSTTVVGHDLVPGSTVRLVFRPNAQLGISAGCNSMGGRYTISGGVLSLADLATTDMACDAPLMQQDQWIAAFLDGATITVSGDTLSVRQGDVAMTLLDRVVADPDRPLESTRWVVDGLISGQAVASVPAGIVADLTISNGRLQVHAGCNTGGGTVEVTSTTITITDLGLTKMACGSDAMSLERAVTAVLAGTINYSITAGTLTLTNGGNGLILRAAD
jgi:heat shock protein HslJ